MAPDVRPDPAAVVPLYEAIGMFLDTIRPTFVTADDRPLAGPSLGALRQAGVPVVSDEEFGRAVEEQADRQCLLSALLEDDGWSGESWPRRRDPSSPRL